MCCYWIYRDTEGDRYLRYSIFYCDIERLCQGRYMSWLLCDTVIGEWISPLKRSVRYERTVVISNWIRCHWISHFKIQYHTWYRENQSDIFKDTTDIARYLDTATCRYVHTIIVRYCDVTMNVLHYSLRRNDDYEMCNELASFAGLRQGLGKTRNRDSKTEQETPNGKSKAVNPVLKGLYFWNRKALNV